MKIISLLDKYGTAKNSLADIEGQIEASIPVELKVCRDRLQSEVKALDNEVKSCAKFIPDNVKHTIAAKWYQLVWSQPKPDLDRSKVEALIEAAGLKVADFETSKDGYWSIRKVGQSK